jgi:acetyl esterase/lipase
MVLFFSCSSENHAQQIYDPSVAKTIQNISYGNSNQQVFDLFLPANRSQANTKTLILIHGGAWTQGDKSDMNYLVDMLRQNLPNYAIANINYRLSTVNNPAFPMQIDDINSVVTALKNSSLYTLSDKIGLIGISAGAHLSMLYSYSQNNIKMVCSIVGPTNFTDSNYLNDTSLAPILVSVTGVNYADNPLYYQQLSPLYRATTTSPPTILFYGNQDPLVPITQGQDIHTKLNDLGVYNEFTLYNGGHGDWSQTDQIDTYTKLIAFINNHF